MTHTFLWHDYETFGLDYTQDRISQFAAIRTDETLETIGEVQCLYCRPTIDALPSPQSIEITGILPQECEEKGLLEVDFARKIFDEMNQPNTISVGYNSMRFDDNVTRFLFWRNLLDPYSREWNNNCSRFDLFPLVVATWALRPEGIAWPTVQTQEGVARPSFKLENLSKANNLAHEKAHDALSDVEATIALAKLIRRVQPKLWDYAIAHRTKQEILPLVNSRKPLLWVSPAHGLQNGYMRLVLPIATSTTNANDVMMWDLMQDPTELLTLTAEEARARLFVKNEDLPNGKERLAIYSCKINQAPFLVSHLGVLSEARAQAFALDKTLALNNAVFLIENMGKINSLIEGVIETLQEQEEDEIDVEAALYSGGFTSRADKYQMQAIHRQTPQAIADSVQEGRIAFEDSRFDELLLRIRARNWPETLTEAETEQWHEFVRSKLIDGAYGSRTLEDFMAELEEMADAAGEDADERMETIYGALCEWAEYVSEAIDG